jgi:hypothetical protein
MIRTLYCILMLGSLAGVLALPAPVRADHIGIGGGEEERSLRPGAQTPYDGMGRMYRINYDFRPAFYFHYDAHRLAYQDYLDRLDRQQSFGHGWHSSKQGPCFQIMRIEQEYWGKWAPGCPWGCPR